MSYNGPVYRRELTATRQQGSEGNVPSLCAAGEIDPSIGGGFIHETGRCCCANPLCMKGCTTAARPPVRIYTREPVASQGDHRGFGRSRAAGGHADQQQWESVVVNNSDGPRGIAQAPEFGKFIARPSACGWQHPIPGKSYPGSAFRAPSAAILAPSHATLDLLNLCYFSLLSPCRHTV